LRTQVLRGKAPLTDRPGKLLPSIDIDRVRFELEQKHAQ
jgi:pyruvate carboxylase